MLMSSHGRGAWSRGTPWGVSAPSLLRAGDGRLRGLSEEQGLLPPGLDSEGSGWPVSCGRSSHDGKAMLATLLPCLQVR